MRQQWVDIAKGVAIIAVVLGHIGYQYPAIRLLPMSVLFAWLWHVPVFFLIGGFFLKEEKLQKPLSFMKGKFRSLYLLILYIYIPVLLMHNWFLQIGFYDTNIEYYGKYVTEWKLFDFLKQVVLAIGFAGREPILGVMWFVYVLLLALSILSIVSWGLKKLINDDRKYEFIRFLVLLLGAVVSCSLTKLFGITIPRGNNTIVAVWLIYVGMMLFQRLHLKFENGYVAIISGVVAYHAATILGGVNLAANDYSDEITLTIISCACLYVICYISKKIEATKTGLLMARVGKDSFYVMGLHFVGFKVFSLILNCFGCNRLLAELCPSVGNSVLLLLGYLFVGVAFPILVINIFRTLKNGIIRCYRV